MIDQDALMAAAAAFSEAGKRRDAYRESLNEAERDYADAHERLMVVAQGLDPKQAYAKEFKPSLPPRTNVLDYIEGGVSYFDGVKYIAQDPADPGIPDHIDSDGKAWLLYRHQAAPQRLRHP